MYNKLVFADKGQAHHYLCTLSIVYNSSSVHARIPFSSRLSWGLDTNYSRVLEPISTTCPRVS